MRRHILATAVALLTVVAAFTQTDAWRLRIDEGGKAENAGDYPQALLSYRAAAEIAETLDPHDVRRAIAWNLLGTMHDALGRFADAEADYRRALKLAAESTGKSGGEYALVLGNLGSVFVETGQIAAGEKLLREALAIHSAADPPDELQLAIAQNGLSEALMLSGKYQEAERLLTSAVAVLERHSRAWGEFTMALNNLGVARFHLGRVAEAWQVLQQALARMEQRMGPDHPLLARTLNNLATIAALTGRRAEAGEFFRRALDVAEKRLGPDHPAYAALLANYAVFLRGNGEKSQAKVLEAKSSQILKDSNRRNGIGAVIDVNALKSK